MVNEPSNPWEGFDACSIRHTLSMCYSRECFVVKPVVRRGDGGEGCFYFLFFYRSCIRVVKYNQRFLIPARVI